MSLFPTLPPPAVLDASGRLRRPRLSSPRIHPSLRAGPCRSSRAACVAAIVKPIITRTSSRCSRGVQRLRQRDCGGSGLGRVARVTHFPVREPARTLCRKRRRVRQRRAPSDQIENCAQRRESGVGASYSRRLASPVEGGERERRTPQLDSLVDKRFAPLRTSVGSTRTRRIARRRERP